MLETLGVKLSNARSGLLALVIRRASIVTFLVFIVGTSPRVWADFEGAWEAYQRGQYNAAVREFLWCAEKGNDLCQLYLGDIYYYGHGTIVRRDRATFWYHKSARQKNSTAAQRLFTLYERTRSIPGNGVKAYMWFKIARILGKETSVKRETKLVAGMTETEKNEAQRLAAEWWLKYE